MHKPSAFFPGETELEAESVGTTGGRPSTRDGGALWLCSRGRWPRQCHTRRCCTRHQRAPSGPRARLRAHQAAVKSPGREALCPRFTDEATEDQGDTVLAQGATTRGRARADPGGSLQSVLPHQAPPPPCQRASPPPPCQRASPPPPCQWASPPPPCQRASPPPPCQWASPPLPCQPARSSSSPANGLVLLQGQVLLWARASSKARAGSWSWPPPGAGRQQIRVGR